MIYWRIQMNQPDGRGGIQINSLDLLNETKPVIGTGEWNNIQCKYFKGEHKNAMKIGDIILVHVGKTPIALCKILSKSFTDIALKEKYNHDNYRYVKVLSIYKGDEDFPATQGTIERFINDTKSRRFINSFYESIIKKEEMENAMNVLLHKKQIILQGPPGTGKTRLAKQIAIELTDKNSSKKIFNLNYDLIKENLMIDLKIANASGKEDYFTIEEISDNKVYLSSEKATKQWDPTFDQIILKFNDLKNGIDPENLNGKQPYEIAVAKYLFKVLGKNKVETKEQYKIIQFHPAYTYEDFVRGISVENNKSGQIEYKTKNRVLAEFADKALRNYNNYHKDVSTYTDEILLEEYFDLFLEHISDKIEEYNGFFKLTDSVGIVILEDDAFRYKSKADGWNKNGNRMLFKDIKQAYSDGNKVRQDIKNNENVSGLAKHHASYFIRVLNLFQKFLEDKNLNFENKQIEKVPLKNYVLIIDEINRANLSSVLGELIYALEYRGESVESMYEIDGDRKITLPPNLFIIGTMNTADRSVGQIDYAIRRRFAFVDVLPKVLTETNLNDERKHTEPKLFFNEDVFLKVEELFKKGKENSEYLSEEFNAKDVQLGHSYFIYTEDNFSYNLEYEIKPILKEYVADGILKDSALKIIENL